MRKILFSIALFFSISSTYSQSFMHGAGVGIFALKQYAADAKAAFSLSYSPRIIFVETEGFSLSVGIPVNIGFSGSYSAEYNSRYGGYEENSLGTFINAPAMFNLNMGAGSSKENESRIGYFIGGGYGLHFGDKGKETVDEYGYPTTSRNYGTSFGPAGNAGVRIAVGSHQKNIEIRLSYMKITSDIRMKVFGLDTYFNF